MNIYSYTYIKTWIEYIFIYIIYIYNYILCIQICIYNFKVILNGDLKLLLKFLLSS